MARRLPPPPLDPSLTASIIVSYKGERLSKFYHGAGTATFINGQVYAGSFWMGHMHGKGRIVWPDGTVYEGDFDYDELCGHGKYLWPDGSSYDGGVSHGLRHGRGHFVQGGVSYDGDWQRGQEHGAGIKVYDAAEGVAYDGDWKLGLRDGQGTMRYAKKLVYKGSWRDDVKAGRGVMQWLDRGESYDGDWLDDRPHGVGTHVWRGGKGRDRVSRYEGEFARGLRDGYGVFYYSNGARYEGHWERNVKHGLGLFFFEDGTIYEGEFDNDRMVDLNDNKPKAGDLAPTLVLYVEDLVKGSEKDKARGVKAAQHAVLRANTDLRLVYRHYAAPAGPPTNFPTAENHLDLLELRQLWRFAAECRLHRVSLGRLDRYLLSVRNAQNKAVKKLRIQRERKRRQMGARAADAIVTPREKWADVHDPSRVVLFREFCEILVRIAWDDALERGEVDMTVADAFTCLYEDKIHDHESARLGPLEAVSLQVLEPDVQSVFAKYRTTLEPLFLRYSCLAGDANSPENDVHLSVRDFVLLLRDANGLGGLGVAGLLKLLHKPLDDDDEAPDFDPFVLEVDLIYPEFLEALTKVALAISGISSVPVAVTVAQYITSTFLRDLPLTPQQS
ncbi:radial spoke head 10 family protein [Achlya hypogyna]|uniref:Radial spoke head 10 family protein n=1 Tax=Achlya hypogyna TaxID=1202772 RepID=A0A1V9Z0M0_ACHHY|nr:radial spoke head 10 family protein [Achlya hypogyna]